MPFDQNESNMAKIPIIKKKFGQSYLVWFQNSNLYTQLEEPAWFVFRKIINRYKAETIASECAIRYGLPFDECLKFVNDIRSNIQQMNQPVEISDRAENYPIELRTKKFIPYSTKRYHLTENLIEFSFENQQFESYFHPLISYLETNKTSDKISYFELYEYEGRSVLRLNGEIKGIWNLDSTHNLIGFTYMSMINAMYNKKDDFWLMTVHAAALTNGRKTILFPAESGNGKTTIAALLQSRGYQLLSDDFVPIDRHLFRAWPFPIAMSVKNGAIKVLSSLYTGLDQRPLTKTAANKTVRYLSPDYTAEFSGLAFPIKEIILIKYDSTVDFEFKTADRLNSIRLMLDQSWILPNPGNSGIFLDQVAQWSFYQLTYSNNEKAMEAIATLFDHDE
jgi:hypothetical protein